MAKLQFFFCLENHFHKIIFNAPMGKLSIRAIKAKNHREPKKIGKKR